MRVLVVCLGNICRSPAGQGVLENLRPDWEIDSAGISGMHVGEAPYRPMQDAALTQDLDLYGQRARRLSPDDFQKFDLILAMDQSVYDACAALGSEDKLAMFCRDGADVPDPYYTRDFVGCLNLITEHARLIVAEHT